jgi:hypothetical protein
MTMTTPGQQGGGDRRERPGIDAARLTEWLAGLDPLDRIAAAEGAGNEALALVGHFAEIRRAAVAEAHSQGADVSLSAQSIRDAVRPDRQLLQSALEILVRPGVSSAASHQLAQGLAPRAPLEAVARRVLAGVQHLHNGKVSGEEHDLIMAAHRRARQILPGG